MTNIKKIEGIRETYAKKLHAVGISQTEDLLKKCASPQGRKEISEKKPKKSALYKIIFTNIN